MRQNFKFKTGHFTLDYNNTALHFYHPSNADELLQSITDEQALKDQYQPYWMEHWPASEVFFTYLSKKPLNNSLRILEIGCGLGTLSVTLHAAHQKVFSIDIAPDACIFCHSNIVLNKFNPRVLCGDMNFLPIKGHFDLIIASDILYEERMDRIVLECLNTLMSNHSRAWIADPCRRGWEAFKKKAIDSNFTIQLLHTQMTANAKSRVEIIELRKVS
jgi:predicted nicotinamide N-methyase